MSHAVVTKTPAAWLATTLLLGVAPVHGADVFSEFLARYEVAPAAEQGTLLDSFIEVQRKHSGLPIVAEDGSVVFVYRAKAADKDVSLLGDFLTTNRFNIYWDPRGIPLTCFGALCYLRQKFEADARLDYMFLIDGVKVADPLNPNSLMSGAGDGVASELSMPAHRAVPETLPRASIPTGTINSVEESWADPAVRVYLPAGYSSARRYPVIYTADGVAWLEQMKLPVVLDNLIAEGSIEPVIVVMIDSQKDRRAWYYYNDDYLAYLGRVIEHTDSTYSTSRRREDRLHIGSSAGGRAALFAASERPAWFGNVALFSAALDGPISYFEPLLEQKKQKKPAAPLRLWISAGTYEGVIYDEARVAARVFGRHGHQVREVYVHQGHSFGAWRELSVDMLRFFHGRQRADCNARRTGKDVGC
jgi:enterochelin esterase-like enzyme